MNSKKLLYLALIAGFIFYLSGCGKEENSIQNQNFNFSLTEPKEVDLSTIKTSTIYQDIKEQQEESINDNFIVEEVDDFIDNSIEIVNIKKEDDINLADDETIKDNISDLFNSYTFYVDEILSNNNSRLIHTELKGTENDFARMTSGEFTTISKGDFIYYTENGIDWFRIDVSTMSVGDVDMTFTFNTKSISDINFENGLYTGNIQDLDGNIYSFEFDNENYSINIKGGDVEKFYLISKVSTIESIDLPTSFTEGDFETYYELFWKNLGE